MAPEDHGDHGDSAIGYVTPNAYTKSPTRRPERARLGHRDIRPGQARSDATYLYSRSARRTAYTPVRGTVPIAPVAGSADAPDEELPPPADAGEALASMDMGIRAVTLSSGELGFWSRRDEVGRAVVCGDLDTVRYSAFLEALGEHVVWPKADMQRNSVEG